MARNIVILCDGTSNGIKAERTNVLRLYGSLERSGNQIVFYDPGVGTMGLSGPFTRLRSRVRIAAGLALGTGIHENVLEAYRFLVEHYRPGDRIYILGFSRGAYTARLLAGFIRVMKLMAPEQLNLLDYAYRAYARVDAAGGFNAEVVHYQKVLQAQNIRIRFLGLWDTVSSVFEPRVSGFGLTLRQRAYTNKNEYVQTVRHALAIDERRSMFMPSLWAAGQPYEHWSETEGGFVKTPQDVKEVWFPGCHGDVGGGEAEADSGLAKVALEWMLVEAAEAGILVNLKTARLLLYGEGAKADQVYIPPDPLAAVHPSLTWPLFKPMEIVPRRIMPTSSRTWPRIGKYYIPLGDRRKIPDGALIHQSVVTRMEGEPVDGTYRPANLPAAWATEPQRPLPPLEPAPHI